MCLFTEMRLFVWLSCLGAGHFLFYVHCMHFIFLVDICVQSALCLARNNVLLYSAGYLVWLGIMYCCTVQGALRLARNNVLLYSAGHITSG